MYVYALRWHAPLSRVCPLRCRAHWHASALAAFPLRIGWQRIHAYSSRPRRSAGR
jgi:hypothetical protein